MGLFQSQSDGFSQGFHVAFLRAVCLREGYAGVKQIESVCVGVGVHQPYACRSPAVGTEGDEIATFEHSGGYGVEECFDSGEDAAVVCRGAEGESIVTENVTQGAGEVFGTEIVQGDGDTD